MNNTSTGNSKFIPNEKGLDPAMPARYYEYYTPKHIVRAVQEVLGVIDLDPCSNSKTDGNVPAELCYTKEDNGLNYMWQGKVFMNPPYGYAITGWIRKLVHHYEKGEVTEAIGLFPASTGSKWFSSLQNYPCCFLRESLTFIRPNNIKQRKAKWSTSIFYFGKHPDRFAEIFSRYGNVYQCIKGYPSVPKCQSMLARVYIVEQYQSEKRPLIKSILKQSMEGENVLENIIKLKQDLEAIQHSTNTFIKQHRGNVLDN